mmetsp:Transcript_13505/g.16362  ORF Transcript_13505/g.16362 Transcript_13505/m.16362 type:complete len:476 (-) Transcript_13505:27-1454(-)
MMFSALLCVILYSIPVQGFQGHQIITRTPSHLAHSPIRNLSVSPLNHQKLYNTPFPHPSSNSVRVPGNSVQRSTSTSLNAILNPAVLTAALGATTKLLSSIGIGALATPAGPKQFGRILDGPAVSALSKLTYWLFQPCFLFCGVAGTLAKASTPQVPGSAAVGMTTSSLLLLPLASLIQISLGFVAAKIITTKRFGIRPAFLGIDTDDEAGASDIRMCTTFANSGPLPLILTDALFRGGLLSDVAACISFYLLAWSPLFWTFGKIILGLNEESDEASDVQSSRSSVVVKQIKSILSPPVMGSILGVIVGSNSVLRNLFISPTGLLAPVFGSLKTFGSAYLPAAILVLSGSLVKKRDPTADAAKTSLSSKTIVSILLSRFILSPIIALSTVRLMTFFKLMPVNNARNLAIVTFALLMEGCMPPAQNSVILLQLANEKDRAGKMAKLLTITYSLSAIPVTLLLSGCLSLSGILNFAS